MTSDSDGPRYNDIQKGKPERRVVDGKEFRRQTTTMMCDKANQKNPRADPAGARADAQVRAGTFGRTGRDMGHRHGSSCNAPPGDAANVYPQNSLQNRQGGTKALLERQRDRIIRQQADVSIREGSTLVREPGRKGFGDSVPIAEVVRHSVYRAGRPTGEQRAVIFGNFPSSSSRYADAEQAAGRTPEAAELKRLVEQDRARLRAQGTATARVMNERAQRARTEAQRAGAAPPRLAVDNTRPVAQRPTPKPNTRPPGGRSR